MEADFSGYATKAGLKCSDGRTIMPDAFKHQDTTTVPLVWQHGHSDPENVLGHAILENREDGVYCYGFFNDSKKAEHARELVGHKDITMMSIWANDLIERSKRVLHGAIREVSLVLSGANPGALIDFVTIRHSDDQETTLDDEAIIYTGLGFEHSSIETKADDAKHSTTDDETKQPDTTGTDAEDLAKMTVQDVYDSMSSEQQQVLHYMIGEALAMDDTEDTTETGSTDKAQHDNLDGNAGDPDKKGSEEMGTDTIKHNVFEDKGKENKEEVILSHDDMKGIIADAVRGGSLRSAVEDYALAHSIDNIDVLFPEPTATDATPQFLSRRVEWVASLLGAVQKSPFSRIKTLNADITIAEARAKGYVTGAMKKEEFFGVSKRITTPTTVYKKQSMDRDDVVDITDFDVILWLKNEMRLMLDEEIARAILLGDGRDVSDTDKIAETNIRPIAHEHELFATTVTVNLRDAASSAEEIIDAIIGSRWQYKGTGTPTLFTSETVISTFLMVKDTLGRRIYPTLAEVASVLRVSSIVPVEAMENNTDNVVGIMVNPVDYVLGATAGGQVSMFDFFDIDYNKQKYLIETRCSGALTKLKSALIVKQAAAGTDTAVVPLAPTFVKGTGVVTIVATVGATYQDADTGAVLAAGPLAPIAPYMQMTVIAMPAAGRFIANDAVAAWTFTREA